jgi:hypothetical protein
MSPSRLSIAVLPALGVATMVQAASVPIHVSATVYSVDCAPAQRVRFRACAKPLQLSSIESRTSVVNAGSGSAARNAFGIHHEQIDPGRQVHVMTLLY